MSVEPVSATLTIISIASNLGIKLSELAEKRELSEKELEKNRLSAIKVRKHVETIERLISSKYNTKILIKKEMASVVVGEEYVSESNPPSVYASGQRFGKWVKKYAERECEVEDFSQIENLASKLSKKILSIKEISRSNQKLFVDLLFVLFLLGYYDISPYDDYLTSYGFDYLSDITKGLNFNYLEYVQESVKSFI